MTFLELCQALRQEAGIPGDGPLTTVNQQGELKRVVDWINLAWTEIQAERNAWKFMWNEVAVPLPAGNCDYRIETPCDVKFSYWDTSSFWIYPEDRLKQLARVAHMDYSEWRKQRDHIPPTLGRPSVLTILPTEALRFDRILDIQYVFGGVYYRAPQVLDEDDETPMLPDRYHKAILYRALRKYADYEEAASLLPMAMANDEKWTSMLEREQLPRVEIHA